MVVLLTYVLFYSDEFNLEKLFQRLWKIVNTYIHTDQEGKFRSFRHIEFATAEGA